MRAEQIDAFPDPGKGVTKRQRPRAADRVSLPEIPKAIFAVRANFRATRDVGMILDHLDRLADHHAKYSDRVGSQITVTRAQIDKLLRCHAQWCAIVTGDRATGERMWGAFRVIPVTYRGHPLVAAT